MANRDIDNHPTRRRIAHERDFRNPITGQYLFAQDNAAADADLDRKMRIRKQQLAAGMRDADRNVLVPETLERDDGFEHGKAQLRANVEARTYDIVSNASYVGEEDQGYRGGRRHLYDSSRNYNIIAPSGDDPHGGPPRRKTEAFVRTLHDHESHLPMFEEGNDYDIAPTNSHALAYGQAQTSSTAYNIINNYGGDDRDAGPHVDPEHTVTESSRTYDIINPDAPAHSTRH